MFCAPHNTMEARQEDTCWRCGASWIDREPTLATRRALPGSASPPAVEGSDFAAGFLRFARGLGRKLLIADPLGSFANQVFAADPAFIAALGISTKKAMR